MILTQNAVSTLFILVIN